MSASDGLRLLFSLGSIGRKLSEYASEIVGASDDGVRRGFCDKRRDILLAMVARRDRPLDAFVIEVSAHGQLYQPRLAWTSDDAQNIWRNGAKLERCIERDESQPSFLRPNPHGGLTGYCIWSNLSREGAKGVALVPDLSRATTPVQYFTCHPGKDESQWYQPSTLDDMSSHGLARNHGSAISAPILLKVPGAQSANEQTCIGAVVILHDDPNYFCAPEHIVWAQECGNLLGLLYELCRDGLSQLHAFSDWEALNAQLNHSGRTSPAAEAPRVDCRKYAPEIDRVCVKEGRKREDIADEMDMSPRRLRLALNEGKATSETTRKIEEFLANHQPDRPPEDDPPPQRPKR